MPTFARALGVAVVVAAAIAWPHHARADGWYFLEGFGAARLSGELGEAFGTAPTFAADVAVGRRIGDFGVQAFVSAVTGLEGRPGLVDGRFEALSYGLDGSYVKTLAGPLSVHLHGGLDNTQVYALDPGPAASELPVHYRGRGLHYGAGLRLSGKVRALGLLSWPLFFARIGPKITASLWVDADRQIVRLHQPGMPTLDGTITAVTFGFALGGGF